MKPVISLYKTATILLISVLLGGLTACREQSVDVLVYSATPGGIASAISAKRQGQSVIIVEPSQHYGGMLTSGLTASDHCNKKAVGGLAREYFKKVGQHYGKTIQWRFEPHVAGKILGEWLKEYSIPVVYSAALEQVNLQAGAIQEITAGGTKYKAKVFIDASYEGDLMARAGVPYRTGREAVSEYNEPSAGVHPFLDPQQFPVPVSAFGADGKVLPGVSAVPMAPLGTGDNKTMAYNFRLCITPKLDNQVPFPEPDHYDPMQYEILARWLQAQPRTGLKEIMHIFPVPGEKYDVNNRGPFSTDLVGGSWEYPEADAAGRAKIVERHKQYTLGLFHFLGNDPRVPGHIRTKLSKLGLCKDEFSDNDNWPYQLYIRVARRMQGAYVLNQNDMKLSVDQPDTIALASCPIESHLIERVAFEGQVKNEGYAASHVGIYRIPYRSITPAQSVLTNLLVPVAISASHIAYSSLRMEPVFMIMGESAGLAADLAIRGNKPVQAVSPAELRAALLNTKQRIALQPEPKPTLQ